MLALYSICLLFGSTCRQDLKGLLVDKLLDTLAKLVPAGAAIAIVAFLYLVVLFKRVSDRFIELSAKQAEFLKERIEVVDKASVIFTRAIEQQEKEIHNLKGALETVSVELTQTRTTLTDRSVEEVTAIGETVRQVLRLQEATLGAIETRSDNARGAREQKALVDRSRELAELLEAAIPKLIERRDLSRHPMQFVDLEGAEALVTELQLFGFAASIYKTPVLGQDAGPKPDDHEAIWVGKRVPPDLALGAIAVVRSRWPFLKYIHISGDLDEHPPDHMHSLLFFGGATSTAKRYGLQPWLDSDISQIPTTSVEEFRSAICTHYG
jgi:hypothetical protein